jgi:predicted phosphodiesterase
MRIITFSDLHLEFGAPWMPPQEADGDLMILAGDIINLTDYRPLERILERWRKPVLYITGNHEYYTRRPRNEEEEGFERWLEATYPQVTLLLDEGITIDGVNFFGGTMWADFNRKDQRSMEAAQAAMNDFRLIYNPDGSVFRPADAITLHEHFVARLLAWFAQDLRGPRVVISHNAPATNPRTKYRNSALWPAFNSLDMVKIVEKHQPALWVYGHTHECDDQLIGATRIISNQLGYPDPSGGFECKDFDRAGLPLELP